MGNKTPLFVRRQSGGMFSLVDETQTTGDIWYCDSGSSTGADAAGYGQNPDSPFLTWNYMAAAMSANNGDRGYFMPGHAETLTTAEAVAISKAGCSFYGIGEGADRPTFTFTSTDNSASVLITGASTKIKNIIGVCGDDGLTNPFHVQAADCELDIEWHDGSTSIEAAYVIVATSAADRLVVKYKHIGFTGGSGNTSAIYLDGLNQARIDLDYFGLANTAVVEFNDTAVVDVTVKGYFYNYGTTDVTKNVVDTATGSTWYVHGFDGAAGYEFEGGSGLALTSAPDLTSVASQATSIATGTVSVGAQVLSAATSIGIGTSTNASNIVAARSQATSIATGTVSVGTQVTAVASQATSVATGTVSLGTQITANTSQNTSIATGTVSVGTQTTAAISQLTSMAIGLASVLSIVTSKP